MAISTRGVDRTETAKDAVFREMREELGTDDFKVLAFAARASICLAALVPLVKGYKGQIQDLFILSLLKRRTISAGKTNELTRWQWVPIEKCLKYWLRLDASVRWPRGFSCAFRETDALTLCR